MAEQREKALSESPIVSTKELPDIAPVVIRWALDHGYRRPIIGFGSNDGIYALGNLGEVGFAGGTGWIAARVEGGWTIIYVGQGSPRCSAIARYGFPAEVMTNLLKCY